MVAMCLKNGEIAIRNLRLYMSPTFENIEALMQGVRSLACCILSSSANVVQSTLAMDTSQASLAWTLITAALRMAQDAGYHRLPPYSVAPDATPKRRLFWFLYCVERSMALNLGRSSSVQDHDIQTDRPKFPEELGESVWGFLFNSWFDFAKLQGDIYDQLYSARAQRESAEVKAELARHLATRLHKIQQVFRIGDDQLGEEPFSDFIKEGLLSISVVQCSTMCLVYRMLPATSSNDGPVHPLKSCDEALEAARKALNIHNEAWNILHRRSKDEWRMFLHW
jgi:hypothetical protein